MEGFFIVNLRHILSTNSGTYLPHIISLLFWAQHLNVGHNTSYYPYLLITFD